MRSSVLYRRNYACNNAKNVKPSMQHRTEDNNQQVEDEQAIQAEEWKAYTDGRWMTLSEDTSGMNRESVKAVGTNAWNEAATDRQYKIRFALREGGFVNRITVHYLN